MRHKDTEKTMAYTAYENQKETKILATNCCVCNKCLKDADSVELGIGPICRRRYTKSVPTPSADQLATALGLVQVANFPLDITQLILSHKRNARKVNNLLVKWASANYRDRNIVLATTPIIRALGYEALANKLESDRSVVSVVTVEAAKLNSYIPQTNTLHVKGPFDWDTRNEFRTIPGARFQRYGRDKGWYMDPKFAELAIAILGQYFGGELCSVDETDVDILDWNPKAKKAVDLPKTTKAQVQALRDTLFPPTPPSNGGNGNGGGNLKGGTTSNGKTIEVVVENGRVMTFTPYNSNFIAAVKALRGRKWHADRKCWSVPSDKDAAVRELIQTHYGVTV
jgi:hypothetical protein